MARAKAWYSYYPADIEADTGDLSCEEFGAYQRLLNHHFKRGSIPSDTKRIASIIRVSPQKGRKLWYVLCHFFYESEGVFLQKRMLKEITKGIEISEKRSKAADARWNANAHANAYTVTTTATKEIEKSMSKPPVSTCQHQEVISAYHDVLKERPTIQVARWAGSESERNLRSRWRENEVHQDIEWWKRFFGAVKTNDWWMGRDSWKGVDLHWLLKRSNFDKVIQHWANQA